MCALAVKEEVRDEALTAWAVRAPEGLPARLGAWRVGLALVGLATLAAAVLWVGGVVGPWPFIGAFVVGRRAGAPAAPADRADPRRRRPPRRRAEDAGGADGAARARDASRRRRCARCAAALDSDGVPPSRRIAQLRRLVDLLESRRNQFAALLMIPLQATAQLALAVESWRRAVGPAVLRWMAAVGEIEALSSLATFHFEHPEYPFPTILDGEGDARRWPRAGVRQRGPRASPDSGRAPRGQRPAPRRRAPVDPGQRLEHVRQEHAAAHGRRERGAGARGRAGVRAAAHAVAAGAGRDAADQRLVAGRASRASTPS